MKKILYILTFAAGMILSSCNPDLLNTNPSSSASQQLILTPDNVQIALNGAYRSLYYNGWGIDWTTEHPGLAGFTLAKSLQAEDNVMLQSGNGWFWYDYTITGMMDDWTHDAGRQFSHWQMYYVNIAQANYVIAAREQLEDSPNGRSGLGQAYALRAFMYLCLTEDFCKGDYAQNLDTPGVPIYTEPAGLSSTGNPRDSLHNVFSRITDDLDEAIAMFEGATAQQHASHIDLYATHGIYARAAMVMNDWDAVWTHANAALEKPGLVRVATVEQLGGFNSVAVGDVLWGFEIISDDAALFGGFLSFMDAENGKYGVNAQQLIDMGLYNQIPGTDYRKAAWWNGELADPDPNNEGQNVNYCQKKFKLGDPATGAGDIINLRAEELILMAAEAACERSDWPSVRSLLQELGDKRDPAYATRLASRTESSTFNADTRANPTTLRDEVLFQRRVELWTEGMGRRFDQRRLNLGFTRAGSNHTAQANATFQPGAPIFVYFLPQSELDANSSLTSADQNER